MILKKIYFRIFYFLFIKKKMNYTSQQKEEILSEFNISTDSIDSKNKDYLYWSIFNIFCFFCIGIPATIASIKVRQYNLRNPNCVNAKKYSQKAYKYNMAATIIGVILFAICACKFIINVRII